MKSHDLFFANTFFLWRCVSKLLGKAVSLEAGKGSVSVACGFGLCSYFSRCRGLLRDSHTQHFLVGLWDLGLGGGLLGFRVWV